MYRMEFSFDELVLTVSSHLVMCQNLYETMEESFDPIDAPEGSDERMAELEYRVKTFNIAAGKIELIEILLERHLAIFYKIQKTEKVSELENNTMNTLLDLSVTFFQIFKAFIAEVVDVQEDVRKRRKGESTVGGKIIDNSLDDLLGDLNVL